MAHVAPVIAGESTVRRGVVQIPAVLARSGS